MRASSILLIHTSVSAKQLLAVVTQMEEYMEGGEVVTLLEGTPDGWYSI